MAHEKGVSKNKTNKKNMNHANRAHAQENSLKTYIKTTFNNMVRTTINNNFDLEHGKNTVNKNNF